jgi:hypothetical protein
MSVQRIKYRPSKKEGYLESTSELVSKVWGSKYTVYIHVESCTYYIYNAKGRRKYKGKDTINSIRVLKRYIRRHLKKLGVDIEPEIRRK